MKRILLTIFFTLMFIPSVWSQTTETPTYPGGEEALFKFLAENIQYPAPAIENGIEGVVVIKFLVEKDGNITKTEIVRPIDPDLEAEAIRVVKSMPQWIPASKDGYYIDSWATLPIKFHINEVTEDNN